MKKTLTLILLLKILSINIYADFQQSFIDTVYSFTPGSAQKHGQGTEYYPQNIFGAPFYGATANIPASSEEDVLSIGRDGEIIVGFKGNYLIDGEGVDFIIFENVFINQATNSIFAEPAMVSVSQNGIDFIEFPYDSLTLVGCAGVHPTNGTANSFDINKSGGDGFDLATIGLDYVKYIKIKDISRVVTHDTEHPYYSPAGMILGFDLDAVAGVHLSENPSSNKEEIRNYIVYNNNRLYYCGVADIIELYSILGERLLRESVIQGSIIDISNYPKGMYFVRVVKSDECLKLIR
ncbi:MAG: hypothetical protein B7C24_12410 [Bacteroidetes bacterium 4572_77]|nr:MAG: hypothetical protein B7C24_12410 [Bacteroidetes bacterium 4572_77]